MTAFLSENIMAQKFRDIHEDFSVKYSIQKYQEKLIKPLAICVKMCYNVSKLKTVQYFVAVM